MRDPARTDSLQTFYEEIAPLGLQPLWTQLARLVPESPVTRVLPARWSYDAIRSHVLRAGELISAEKAERRVLILENPGLPQSSAITATLYAGLQLILPGEVAPAHRHAQNAIRFVMEGQGAFTAIDGHRVRMQPFDLVLTPSMTWHDHGNESSTPMIWLDGLDIPLIQKLDIGYAEKLPGGGAYPLSQQAIPNAMEPGLVPTHGRSGGFSYPYVRWRAALNQLVASGSAHPADGYSLTFKSLVTEGPILSTIGAFAQLLPDGFVGQRCRSTDSRVYVVCEGRGQFDIGGNTYDVAPRDIIVCPPWAERRFKADQQLIIFGFSDEPVQRAFGLWRKEQSTHD